MGGVRFEDVSFVDYFHGITTNHYGNYQSKMPSVVYCSYTMAGSLIYLCTRM